MSIVRRILLCFVVMPILGVGGCASFHVLPLPTTAGSASAATLSVEPSHMPVRALASHRFDPTNGLDETETAMLAVANNPHLKLLRDDLGIAHAQAFAAGLLPDPQVTWSQDFVTGAGGSSATSPFALGISWNVGQLLTYSSRTQAADWNRKKVDLDLLWAAWQTVAQARVLFSKVMSGRVTVARLQAESAMLQPLGKRIERA
ncbi:MAG: TolC family protein, partial [Sinobacteraceae bacterium]|nr:TolC family protein [Nevskiaceae bacterium]